MTNKQAILYVESTAYSFNAGIQYREDNGEKVPLQDKCLPEALNIVVGLAKKQLSDNKVEIIVNQKEKKND